MAHYPLYTQNLSLVGVCVKRIHGSLSIIHTKSIPSGCVRQADRVINKCDSLKFPEFSGGGEYLSVQYFDDVFPVLGSPEDDYENFFTARVLLILESKCIFNVQLFENLLKKILEEYYRDFADYEETFFPSYLLNDVLRYWKTLCLNYEYRCRKRAVIKKTKHKSDIELEGRLDLIKLKFSRLLTCYSFILSLAFLLPGVDVERVKGLIAKRPLERLSEIIEAFPEHRETIYKLILIYENFLSTYSLPRKKLSAILLDDEKYNGILEEGHIFGDLIYELIVAMASGDMHKRFLVV